jgi:transposase InsO family protein
MTVIAAALNAIATPVVGARCTRPSAPATPTRTSSSRGPSQQRIGGVPADGYLATDAARCDEPFGFCHYSPAPGYLVAADSFYIGNLKGVGKVYQLTAIDVATRWAVMLIVMGPVTATHTIGLLDHVVGQFRRRGVSVRAVLTDNRPEWIASGFRAHLTARQLEHHRIPPRSPNHNAVCERFHGTALQECWRPAFHRRRFTTIGQLPSRSRRLAHRPPARKP